MSGNTVILLTPSGAGAIAVVRVAGPGAAAFVREHFTRAAVPGRCVYGELIDEAKAIDDAVVVLAPHGAWADLNVHGGPWVVHRVMELARRAGFCVEPQNGPPLADVAIDAETLLQREIIAHLPLARTEQGIRMLLAQERAWQSPPRTEEIARILSDRSLHLMLHPPRVAIVGAPNVGKSALANQLFAQERSITADLPGTTRDWVGDDANIDGLPIHLIDTPGQHAAPDPIESQAIRQSAAAIAGADLVLLVLDPTQSPSTQQPLLTEFARALVILNKSDLATGFAELPTDAVRTVATTGQGLDDLRRAIHKRLGVDAMDLASRRWWTERQRDLLKRWHNRG